MKTWSLRGGVILLLVAAVFAVYRFTLWRMSRSESTQVTSGAQSINLPEGLSVSEYETAKKWLVERVASRAPTHLEILVMAGDLAAADGNTDTAIACYRAIPTDSPTIGLAAKLQEGLLLIGANRASEAEAAFRQYIEVARVSANLKLDDVVTSFKWLNFILSVEIRLEDRKELLAEMHEIGIADPFDSKQLFFPNLLILNSPTGRTRLAKFLENDSENFQLRLASGRYKTLEGQFDVAVQMLEPMLAEKNADLGVGAALLDAYFESNNSEKFASVLNSLPDHSELEPWLLTRMRGEFALEKKEFREAIRYFEAALRKDPAYAPCQMGLARAYAGIGEVDSQTEALRRSSVLAEIRVNLSSVQPDATKASLELADKCTSINLLEAAEAFRKHAETLAANYKE